MNYETFLDKVLLHLSMTLPEDSHARIENITKNNDCIVKGLIISDKNELITPTIYMSYYYDLLLSGETFENVMDKIMSSYEHNRVTDAIDMSFFLDYDKVKDKIIYKLVNYEKNRRLLDDIPYVKCLDLAIVFCYYMDNYEKLGSGTILIHNNHAKAWGVDEMELLEVAKNNTKSVLGESILEMPPFKILSNAHKISGAASMLNEGTLSEIASELDSDLIIIPSSIHEVILIPDSDNLDKNTLDDMVKAVNQGSLEKEEILSDHVYYYSREEDCITC